MKKQPVFPKKEDFLRHRADGDQPKDTGAGSTPSSSSSSGFNLNGFFDSLFGNAGGILNGVGTIVGAANNKSTTNTTTVDLNTTSKNAFSWSNGTTVTAIVIGGVAIVIALILVLKK